MGKRVRKFMDGRETPQEFWENNAFPKDAKCLCGRRPSMKATTFAPLDEVIKRDPIFAAAYASAHPMMNTILVHTIVGGTHVRLATAYACRSCGPEMEKALAKGPSWCVIDFQRGPGAEKPTVGYTG